MIVADTHIIIWNALKPEMLSRKAKKAISEADNFFQYGLNCFKQLPDLKKNIGRRRCMLNHKFLRSYRVQP